MFNIPTQSPPKSVWVFPLASVGSGWGSSSTLGFVRLKTLSSM